MLRFIPRDKPSHLINFIFKIKIIKSNTQSSDPNDDFNAQVVQLFPKSNPDQAIIKSVQLFAFPDRTSIESRCFFSFVIGNPSTEFQIGFINYYTYFDAYCVLSDYYYPDMFQYLMTLEEDEILEIGQDMSKDRAFSYIDNTDNYTIKKKTFPLDGGIERQKLTQLLFTTFPPYDLTKIIIGMLSARHVFIVASNASTCSKFAAAIPILIEPFFWDLNLIPILPYKIREMIEVPVPAMIGITRSELLNSRDIAPHICINCDTKHVLDSPVFEQSNINLRLKVVRTQMEFHKQVVSILNDWKNAPGFPASIILEKVMIFISLYLKLYTGECTSSAEFRCLVQKNLPDFLLNSQIVHEILILDELPEENKKLFKKWFNCAFVKDAAIKMVKRKQIVSKYYNRNPIPSVAQPIESSNQQTKTEITSGQPPPTTESQPASEVKQPQQISKPKAPSPPPVQPPPPPPQTQQQHVPTQQPLPDSYKQRSQSSDSQTVANIKQLINKNLYQNCSQQQAAQPNLLLQSQQESQVPQLQQQTKPPIPNQGYPSQQQTSAGLNRNSTVPHLQAYSPPPQQQGMQNNTFQNRRASENSQRVQYPPGNNPNFVVFQQYNQRNSMIQSSQRYNASPSQVQYPHQPQMQGQTPYPSQYQGIQPQMYQQQNQGQYQIPPNYQQQSQGQYQIPPNYQQQNQGQYQIPPNYQQQSKQPIYQQQMYQQRPQIPPNQLQQPVTNQQQIPSNQLQQQIPPNQLQQQAPNQQAPNNSNNDILNLI